MRLKLRDVVIADYLEWEARDLQETIEDLREGLRDIEEGRTQPAAEMFEELRKQYGFPG